MRLLVFLSLFIAALFVSCEKETTSTISGLYNETIPIPGRSQLNFIFGQRVVKIEPGGTQRDTFYYAIHPGKILLTPAWSNDYDPMEFYFEVVDDNSFRIGDLYPSLLFVPDTMVYSR